MPSVSTSTVCKIAPTDANMEEAMKVLKISSCLPQDITDACRTWTMWLRMLNIFDEGALVGGVHKESFSHLRVHRIFGVGSYGAVIGVSVGRIAKKILAVKLSVGGVSLLRRAQLSFNVQQKAASSDLAPGALALYETKLASGTSLTAMVMDVAGPSLWTVVATGKSGSDQLSVPGLGATTVTALCDAVEALFRLADDVGFTHADSHGSNIIVARFDGLIPVLQFIDFDVAWYKTDHLEYDVHALLAGILWTATQIAESSRPYKHVAEAMLARLYDFMRDKHIEPPSSSIRSTAKAHEFYSDVFRRADNALREDALDFPANRRVAAPPAEQLYHKHFDPVDPWVTKVRPNTIVTLALSSEGSVPKEVDVGVEYTDELEQQFFGSVVRSTEDNIHVGTDVEIVQSKEKKEDVWALVWVGMHKVRYNVQFIRSK